MRFTRQPLLGLLPWCSQGCMMTSSNGIIFRVTGPLWGESWPVDSPHKGQWRGALKFSLIWAWTNGWANNRGAGDLRRHRLHYDVTVMPATHFKIEHSSMKSMGIRSTNELAVTRTRDGHHQVMAWPLRWQAISQIPDKKASLLSNIKIAYSWRLS